MHCDQYIPDNISGTIFMWCPPSLEFCLSTFFFFVTIVWMTTIMIFLRFPFSVCCMLLHCIFIPNPLKSHQRLQRRHCIFWKGNCAKLNAKGTLVRTGCLFYLAPPWKCLLTGSPQICLDWHPLNCLSIGITFILPDTSTFFYHGRCQSGTLTFVWNRLLNGQRWANSGGAN